MFRNYYEFTLKHSSSYLILLGVLFLSVFFTTSLMAQSCDNGSFIVDQSALNLTTNGSGSYSATGCGDPFNIMAISSVTDPGSGDVVTYDSYTNSIFMAQNGGGTPTNTITYTFASPIQITNLRIGDIDQASSYNDDVTVTATGANVNVTNTSATVSIIGGNGTPSAQVRATGGGANDNGDAFFSTDGQITQLTITYTDINSNSGQRFIYIFDIDACCPVEPSCDAGPLPPVTEIYHAIPCGQSTIDLTGITTDRQPSGTTISFHSGTPATDANKIDATSLSSGTYYIAYMDELDGTTCFSPTSEIVVFPSINCSVTEAPCGETVAQGTHSGGQTGSITSAVGSATYAITEDNSSGYNTGETYSIDSENGVKIFNPQVLNGGDSFTYTYTVTPNDSNDKPQIRFYQARGQGGGNNEASTYTISWVGGVGNAVYYDNIASNCSIYTATAYPYTSSCPSGFDINNREIVGLSTTGELPNGGAFQTYMINNNSTEWYVEFPKGATSVTVTKTVNTGGNVGGSGCGQSSEIASCGIDSQYPYYGSNLNASNLSGESFNEWISFNTKLIEEQCASITGTVFQDDNNLTDNTVNGDGIGNPSSVPLYANLLNASGTVVATVPINSEGSYTFTNVVPANGYTVQISTTSETPGTSNPSPSLPSGWANTGENIGAGSGDDGNVNGVSAPIDISSGQTQTEVNFGISNVGTISGKVEADTNGDGTGDSPLSGVVIELLDANGDPVLDTNGNAITTTTDSNGEYIFENVPVGTGYQVRETDPDGYSSVSDTQGDNNNIIRDIDVSAGQDSPNNNFVDEQGGTISGNVSADTTGDGNNDTNLQGVTIELLDENGDPVTDANGDPITTTTDMDGNYSFDNVSPGEYQVRQQQPENYATTGDSQSTDNDTATNDSQADNIIPVTLTGGETDANNNFTEKTAGSISGIVQADTNADGMGDSPLENVTLALLDSNGDPVTDANGDPITTTTDENGNYSFDEVPVGNGYQVQETDPDGYNSVSDTQGDNDNLITGIDVTAGQDSPNNNFVDEQGGTISGNVSADTTGDGNNDTNLQGVTIELLDGNGDPVTDANGDPVTTTTDMNGNYSFDNVSPGEYQVRQQQPDNYATTGDSQSTDNDTATNDSQSDNLIPVTLTSGETDASNNFTEEAAGSISGNVSEDSNGDGMGDTALEGVVLALLDSNGDPVSDANGDPITTTTDENGNYSFDHVPVGTGYQVQETDPNGYTSSSDNEGFNNNKVTGIDVTAGQDTMNNNFVDSTPVSISGTVLADENGNGTADNPLANVTIELLDANGDPVLDANGNPITTTTDSNGNYSFMNLPKGMYQLRQEQPEGYTSTDDADGNGTENIISVDATSSNATAQNFEEESDSALPVGLISFSAKTQGGHAILQWTTASEINNDRFEVESSLNGEDFNKIGKVNGSGTTSEIKHYSYIDRSNKNRASGIYYRLKQIDYDGAYEYSTVVYVSFDDIIEEIKVYPNPTTNWLQIDIKEAAEMRIYNLEGKIVKRQALEAGYNSINITELESGNYLIKVGDSNIKKVIKL